MIKRFLAGSFDGGKTTGRNASEYGDHLSITVVRALQSLADLFHRGWQDPFAEGSAIAQGTRFASEDRNIVPGVVDSVATTKAAPVFSDRHSILFYDDPISIRQAQEGKLMERTQVLELMSTLKLYGMRSAYDEVMGNGIKRQYEPPRIVGDLLQSEIAEKQARSIRYQLTIAKLPLAKDIDDFDFADTPISESLVRELAHRHLSRRPAQCRPCRRHWNR